MTLVTQHVYVENQEKQHVADMIVNTVVLNSITPRVRQHEAH